MYFKSRSSIGFIQSDYHEGDSLVRVQRLDKANLSDNFIIRFRHTAWETTSHPSSELESDLRKRFRGVSPDEVVEIRSPHTHEALFLEVREIADFPWLFE